MFSNLRVAKNSTQKHLSCVSPKAKILSMHTINKLVKKPLIFLIQYSRGILVLRELLCPRTPTRYPKIRQ